MSIRGADFGALVERLQLKGPLPLTTGSLDVSLKTAKPLWTAGLEDVNGQVVFQAGAGSIANFDVEAIRNQAAQQRFFPLNAAGDHSFPFTRAELTANLSAGSADLENVRVQGTVETLSLSGLIPLQSSGLALSGSLQATDDTRAAELPLLPFFIGGSWPNPVISPVPVVAQPAPNAQ
jgi:AsmA protein